MIKNSRYRKIFFITFFTILITLFSPILTSKINLHTLAYSDDEFVTTWKTNNTGTSNSTSITIPTNTAEWTYLYNVDWECDGIFDDFNVEGDITHDYGSEGTYNVCIQGTFPQIYFNATGDRLKILDVKQWGSVGWKSMKNAFYGAENLTGTATDAPVWDLTVTEISFAYAFAGASKFNGPIGNWDTSKVTNMSFTFFGARLFNQPIGGWVTDSLTDMRNIFRAARAFNQDVNDWNVSNIKSMENVFNSATRFNKPLDKWDIGNVETTWGMFNGAKAFNQPIGNWDVRNVKDMYSMFNSTDAFNQDIGSWETNSLIRTWCMFCNAKAFNQYIGDWNTSSLYDSKDMFRNATSFNQPLTNWDTSKLQVAGNMFNGATAFNQDISHFNISSLTNAGSMLNNSGLSTEHYDALLNAWAGQPILKSNVAFGAVGINYCTAKPAIDFLTDDYNWSITNAGSNCPPQNLSLSNTEVYENTTAVGYVSATDEGDITYTLVDGEGNEDNTKFDLDPNTGALAFLQPPDYENPTGLGDPTDANKYHIRVRATDTTNLYIEETFIITVKDADEVAPVITITAQTKMDREPITNTTFTVNDRFSVASVEVDESSEANADSIVCTPAFPYTNPAPSPENHIELSCTIRITSSGTLVLKATDNAGHSSTETEEGYIIDTIPPTFSVASVDTATNGIHNPIVHFKAEDSVGIEKYEITYIQDNNGEGTSPDETTETVTYTGGVQQFTINLDPDEAIHVIEITAYDNVGNTTTKEITFPPLVTITAPTIISNQTINDTTVTITSPVDGNEIDNIVISGSASDGVTLKNCIDKSSNTETPYDTTVTCEVQGIKTTGTLIITAEDITTGATNSNSQQYIYDTIPADITINAPIKAQKDNIDVTVTITDNVELYTEGISTDSSSAGVENLLCQINEDDQSKANCSLTITESGNLVISVTDRAGNPSTATEEDFIIDRIPPEVTIDDPTVVNSNNQTSYTLSGTCTTGDKDLTITIDTELHTAICSTESRWSLLTNLSTYSDGEIVVTVEQTDAVGNQTTKSTTLQKDTVLPTVTINQADGQADPTNINSAKFTIIFSKPIKGGTFTKEDIDVTGSTTYQKGEVTKISDTEYGLEVTNLTDGDKVTVNIPTGVCEDLVGNYNTASTSTDNSVTYDITPPTVTVNQADDQVDPTNVNEVKFTIIFSELINEETFFTEDLEILGSNTATVSDSTKVNGTTYTVLVTNILPEETISLNLPAGKVEDLAGNKNIASTSTDNSVLYTTSRPIPTVELDGDQEENTNILPIKLKIHFSKPVKGLEQENVTILGSTTATIIDFTKEDGEYVEYFSVEIDNATDGDLIELEIAENTAQDMAGNLSTEISNSLVVKYDTTKPTVSINQADGQEDPTSTDSAKFTLVFSEPIIGLNPMILTVTGTTGLIKSITKISDTEYMVEIAGMTSNDTVRLSLDANKVRDLAGNLNEASTSADNSITYFVPKPIIPTPLDPKPVVKPKNPLTKYINPIIETEQEEDTKAEEETSDTTKEPSSPTQSKSLKIKVYNESGEPLVGVTVEIHSDVRTGITDEKGEVYFENLDTGLHTMIIAYNGYRAEKKINLISDGEEEMEINVKVEKVSNINYWLIAIIVLLIILLGYKIYKGKKREK